MSCKPTWAPVSLRLRGDILTAEASRIVDELRGLGFVGVGQSSWGPTLYAFSSASEQELTTSAERIRQRFGLDDTAVFWTKAANQGARFSFDG